MKSWKKLNLLGLSFLVACSSAPKQSTHEVVAETYQYPGASRSIASLAVTKNDLSTESVRKTLKSIFHSYILGQTLLYDFDAALDKDAGKAMESDVYSELMAIRMSVDHLEEEINELYIKLVLVNALPSYNDDQKTNARKALVIIGQFVEGIVSEQEIPENLRHLVLGNLREKQTHLYDELMSLKNDSSVTLNDPLVINSIHAEMINLRATRMKFYKDMKDYQVDEAQLKAAVAEMNKDQDFKRYRSELKKTSKEIRKFNRAVIRGRSTSSDVIYPNAGTSGNITGRSFPANTWSITYDDGPGGKTSPTILKHLQDKGLKATFFMLAKQVEALPNTAKSIADAGMDIASHSYDHAQLTKISGAALDKQIGGSKKIIEAKLGKTIKLFRLPYGAGVSVSSIRAKIAEQNMIHVFWNVDTLDWQDKNPASIVARAKKQMAASGKNAGVVLFHDIHSQSVTASVMLMDEMIKEKINVCTVQGVVDQINKGLESCQ